MTEDEVVGWHHQLNRYEFEQALGVEPEGRRRWQRQKMRWLDGWMGTPT